MRGRAAPCTAPAGLGPPFPPSPGRCQGALEHFRKAVAMTRNIAICTFVLACIGCARDGRVRTQGTESYNTLAPLDLKLPPSVQTQKAFDFDASAYKTFSVFSPSLVIEKPRIAGLL